VPVPPYPVFIAAGQASEFLALDQHHLGRLNSMPLPAILNGAFVLFVHSPNIRTNSLCASDIGAT